MLCLLCRLPCSPYPLLPLAGALLAAAQEGSQVHFTSVSCWPGQARHAFPGAGDVDGAAGLVQERLPALQAGRGPLAQAALFHLGCQKYIELVRWVEGFAGGVPAAHHGG